MAAALRIDQNEFTTTIKDALRRAFGTDRSAVKQIAIAANSNPRAAENWWNGRNAPDGLHLLRLGAMVPEVGAEVRRLMGMEAGLDPELQRDLVRLFQTTQKIQALKAES